MILLAPLSVAFLPPAANLTMSTWLCRSCDAVPVLLNRFFQTRFDEPAVCGKIEHSILLRPKIHSGRDHIHRLRQNPLDAFQELGIKRKLKDGCRLCFAGQFAVVDFIRPAAELAGPLNPPQHVRTSKPSPICQRRLSDCFSAAFHRCTRFRQCLFRILNIPQIDNGHSPSFQMR
jgi:hypothetical protein